MILVPTHRHVEQGVDNHTMATAVFFDAVTIHTGEKYESLDASLFVQSDSLLLQSWPERSVIWRTVDHP